MCLMYLSPIHSHGFLYNLTLPAMCIPLMLPKITPTLTCGEMAPTHTALPAFIHFLVFFAMQNSTEIFHSVANNNQAVGLGYFYCGSLHWGLKPCQGMLLVKLA